jgi:hypothetical protein
LNSQELLQEHRHYLDRIVREGEITPQLSEAAWDVLADMLDVVGPDLEIPDAIPGVDGKLFYTWKRDDQYLELEMLPDGTAEFFFRNRKTGDTWSEAFRLGQSLPSRAIAEIRQFQPACRSTGL